MDKFTKEYLKIIKEEVEQKLFKTDITDIEELAKIVGEEIYTKFKSGEIPNLEGTSFELRTDEIENIVSQYLNTWNLRSSEYRGYYMTFWARIFTILSKKLSNDFGVNLELGWGYCNIDTQVVVYFNDNKDYISISFIRGHFYKQWVSSEKHGYGIKDPILYFSLYPSYEELKRKCTNLKPIVNNYQNIEDYFNSLGVYAGFDKLEKRKHWIKLHKLSNKLKYVMINDPAQIPTVVSEINK